MQIIKRIFKSKEAEYYGSIYDLPIYNWFKAIDLNNLGFLRKESTFLSSKEVDQDNTQKAEEVWHYLINQKTEEFGQDERYTDLLTLRKQIGLLQVQFAITKNKRILTDIVVKQSQLPDNEKKGNFDYNKEIGIVSKWLGYSINPRKMSLYEYEIAKKQLKAVTNG